MFRPPTSEVGAALVSDWQHRDRVIQESTGQSNLLIAFLNLRTKKSTSKLFSNDASGWCMKKTMLSLEHAWSSSLISMSLDILHQAWCVDHFLIVEVAKLSQFLFLAQEE